MTFRIFSMRTGIAAALAAAVCGTAMAEDNFCSEGDSCIEVEIHNRSAALVKSVKIEQHTTDGACEYSDNTFSQNLSGTGGDNMEGDSFMVDLDKSCKYKIKFKTSSGCTGDKTTHLTPEDFADSKSLAQLRGACGSLKVKTY